MPDALAVTGGPDWAAMDHEHRGLVLADYIAQFGRRTLTEFWIIGRGLEAHAPGLNKGDGGWYAYLDQIGMKPAVHQDETGADRADRTDRPAGPRA